MVFIAPSKVLLSATSLSSVSSPAMRLIPIKISIMKAKLLLLLCCLFAIEGWANSNDIHLLKDSRSNPMGIPIQPTYEKCAILSNILNVSFGRAKDYAIITVTNKATGEIVHSKTYHNTSIVMIDMSSCEKGEYTIHIILNDCLLEGTFTVQ